MLLQKPTRRLPRWLKIVLGICALGLIMICGGLAFITFWPDVAAQNIDQLRDIIGDEPVAQLEAVVLSIQDHTQQLAYQLGLVHPAAPWTDSRPTQSQLTPTEQTNIACSSIAPSPSTCDTPAPSPNTTFKATYIPATCLTRVGESIVYATHSVSFTANLHRDGRDSAVAYGWFVNGASAGGGDSRLTYTFPTPGSYTVKLTVIMQSGQSASCETTVEVKDPTAPMSTYTISPTKPNNTLSSAFTQATTVPLNTPTPTRTDQAPGNSTSPPTIPPTLALTATPISILQPWQPTSLTPLGKLVGEGQWSPYLQAADGQTTLAYRAYLQPDPHRPYSTPAIVAFDLQATRLHFVLGTIEPKPLLPQPSRTGAIPDAEKPPGVLLATFNGGFKARHGHYGAMADGLIALPAINERATVAIYADGHVQIGEWGTEIKDSPDLVAWRQNGEMLIHNGQINPDTARTTVTWGLTIKGDAVTWRSALGLSADGRTLYYVAGRQLDVATLAQVMAQTGAAEALQLDVNNYWVHFAAIRSEGASLVAEPLLEWMKPQADRYLKSYSRDFFYVTTASRQ